MKTKLLILGACVLFGGLMSLAPKAQAGVGFSINFGPSYCEPYPRYVVRRPCYSEGYYYYPRHYYYEPYYSPGVTFYFGGGGHRDGGWGHHRH